MFLKVLMRLLFIVFVIGFSVNVYSRAVNPDDWNYPVAVIYATIAGLVAAGLVFFEWRMQRSLARDLVAVMFGLMAGLLVSAVVVGITVALFLPSSGSLAASFTRVQPALPLIVVGLCYMAITVVLQTKDDFRFLLPYIDFSQRGTQEGGIVLDTSAIIDGRIVDLCTTGLITAPIVIPDFVVREVQALSDSQDKLKRQRGRRGLDMVTKLQKAEGVRVVVRETTTPLGTPVDDELVRFTKEIHGRILTTDFNLNKVSQIEGIIVVNINDFANAVKPLVLPGDALHLKVIRAGQEEGQGVGYLQDGTMVVVEHSREYIGETIDTVVTGAIQTSAGRMIFARPAGAPSPEEDAKPSPEEK